MTDQDNALALIQNVLDDISLPRWQHDALSQAADAITAMQPTPQHHDDEAVDRFAVAMKAKLAKKRADGRGGWNTPDCSQEFLSRLLCEHVGKGDPVDVGNLAMMLHQRDETISLVKPTPQQAAYETCGKCNGSGMVIRDSGDPGICPRCKGDTVQPAASPTPTPQEAAKMLLECDQDTRMMAWRAVRDAPKEFGMWFSRALRAIASEDSQ